MEAIETAAVDISSDESEEQFYEEETEKFFEVNWPPNATN
jgi:hypothetical protein